MSRFKLGVTARVIAVVSVLALVAGACSSGDDDDAQVLEHIESVLETLQAGEDAIAAGLQGARQEIGAALADVRAGLEQISVAVGAGELGTNTTTTTVAPTTTTTATTLPPEVESATIGYISLGDSVPFVKLVSDGIKEEADRLGVDLIFCDSEIDAAKALACAQDFEVRGVQGVLNFQVFEESSPEICAAHGDVPVIAIDIIQPPCQTSFMGANNRLAGQLGGSAMGRFIMEEFGCDYTAYVSLESTAAGAANRDRMGGYREGFQEFCPIVNERVLDGADRTDPALEQMTNLLTAVPGDRIVVVAINEDGILGAIGAANTLGRQTDLYYSGQGTDPSIWCDIVNNPNYIASVAYFPERYGTILVPAILNAVAGNAIAGQLFTDHQVITSENIAEVYPDSASGC